MTSNQKENKVCANCSFIVEKKFCSNCGQKHLNHKENVWHLFLHFFEDITHFDSRLHKSLTPLLFKPGFLTNQYNVGKRTTYLNPVRMYIFVSLIYFLSVLLPTHRIENGDPNDTISYAIENDAIKRVKRIDAIRAKKSETNTHINIAGIELNIKTDSNRIYTHKMIEDSINVIKNNPDYSYLTKISKAQSFKLSHTEKDVLNDAVANAFTKNIPKMMFILLPIFALILKLLYVRKNIYFIDHGIFSIHFHCFVFLNFLIQNILTFFINQYDIITIALWLGLFIYLYLSIKKVYNQEYLKTFFKFFSLLFTYSIVIVIALFVNFVITLLLI